MASDAVIGGFSGHNPERVVRGGYNFNADINSAGVMEVTVSVAGKQIAEFQFVDDASGHEGELYPMLAEVEPPYQRQGIATLAYSWAEELTGLDMVPSQDQTPAARKFWMNRIKSRAESLLDRLGEGSKGDWEKEGYSLSHVDTIDNAESPHFGDKNYRNLIISARDKSGKWVARTHISYPFGGFDKPSTKYKGEIMRTDVDPKDQRKGIATAMYRYAEKILGGPLHPGGEQSPDAKALWANPGRAFGSKA